MQIILSITAVQRQFLSYREREMTESKREEMSPEKEEAQAEIDIWRYVFGFVEMAVVKCAIELGIADVLENRESPMTLSQLSRAVGCYPAPLHRIMRFLINIRIFREKPTTDGSAGYLQTPLSRRLMRFIRDDQKSMAPFVLLGSSPVMLAPWHNLSAYVRGASGTSPPFEAAHGDDAWGYAAGNAAHSQLFNEAMACDARVVVPAMVKGCPEVFEGLSTLVDVGGGNGTMLRSLVKAFPWIRGINFDLAHVVSAMPECEGVERLGGDMFDSIPKADAAILKWVLHDWGDEECIQILKKCKEAISQEKGKVIIVEAVIEEEKEYDYKGVGLMLDMVMMAHTNKGKERTSKEWGHVLGEAGFSRHTIKRIHAVQAVIEAYP